MVYSTAPREGAPTSAALLVRPMTDFAPLSTAKRWALGSAEKPPSSLGRFELKRLLGEPGDVDEAAVVKPVAGAAAG